MTTPARILRPAASLALLAVLAASAFTLSACNTVAGAGQDVSSAGHDVTSGAAATAHAITNP